MFSVTNSICLSELTTNKNPSKACVKKKTKLLFVISRSRKKNIKCSHTESNNGANSVLDILVGFDEDISPC